MTDTEYNEAVKEMLDVINKASKAHRDDIAHISGTAIDWAKDHNLTDEWNQFVDDINDDLKYDLDKCVKSFTVYKRFIVTVAYDIDATDDEHAIELAGEESVDFYTTGSWEVHDEDYDDTWVRES